MKKKIQKNIKQRFLFKNFEKKRFVLKILLNNLFLNKKNRIIIKNNWNFFKNNTSLTRVKNFCILTGRSRSISRFLKLSRLKLRLFISKGFLPGFAKYSW